MAQRRPLLHWILLFALVAMWGSSFLSLKVAVTALAPETVVTGRLWLGAAILVALVVILRRPLPRSPRLWGYFIVMALLGNALPYWLIAWGQQGIDSGLAGIFMAFMPLATLVLAHFFVEGEGLTVSRMIGFVAGFAGVVVLIGPQALLELKGEGTALLYELAMLGAALCYAVNTIIARKRPSSDSYVSAAGVMALATIFYLPVTPVTTLPLPSELSLTTLLAVAYLGIVSTALATIVFFKLVTLAGPTFLSLINYLIPLWAVLLGALVLGEEPTWSSLLALGLILGGIALSERRKNP